MTKFTVSALIGILLFSEISQAQLVYQFLEDDPGSSSSSPWEGAVLAFLELSSVPATHEQVLSLEFTADVEYFGSDGPIFPANFNADFDTSNGSALSDGLGGLTGNLQFTDNDAQPPVFTDANTSYRLGFDDSLVNFDVDTMTAIDPPLIRDSLAICVGGEFSTTCPFGRTVLGHWQLVPEPSGYLMMTLPSLWLVGFMRRQAGMNLRG